MFTKRFLSAALLLATAMPAFAHQGEAAAPSHAGDHLGGILAGIAMFFLFEGAILYLRFKPWFQDPNRKESPSPEQYFHTAIYSFGAMVITGGILTKFFSGVDMEKTPLMAYYGYNNVCVVFDSPPSTYICPVYWFFIAYLIVRYAVEDTKRLVLQTTIDAGTKAFAYGLNVALVAVAAFFSLCLAIRPELDMKGHTLPFVALVIALPLVFLMHWKQSKDRSPLYLGIVGLYMILSLAKAIFDLYALTSGDHVSPSIAQGVDLAWLALAISTPFVIPAPEMPGSGPRLARA